MSLIFDLDKDKNIAMMVETSGIENPDKLEFTFNITVKDVKYGFPCELKEGKVEICIPPLNTVISNVKSGTYKASLDVTGDKNYFLQPFNEEVTLKREPKVDVIVDDNGNDTTMKEAITASISKIIDNDVESHSTNESSKPDDINTSDKKKEMVVKRTTIDKMFS